MGDSDELPFEEEPAENERGSGPYAQWLDFLRQIEVTLSEIFYWNGYYVAMHPRKVQVGWFLIVIFSAVGGFGVVGNVFETDPTKLWVISDSVAVNHDTFVRDTFASSVGAAIVFQTGSVEPHEFSADLQEQSLFSDAEVLTPAFVAEALKWDARVRGFKAECRASTPIKPSACEDGSFYSYEDICYRPGGAGSPCYVISPLELLKGPAADLDMLMGSYLSAATSGAVTDHSCASMVQLFGNPAALASLDLRAIAGALVPTATSAGVVDADAIAAALAALQQAGSPCELELGGLAVKHVCPVSCAYEMAPAERLTLVEARDANSGGPRGVPQDALTSRRGPLGPSSYRESAIGNAPALAPGPLAGL
jgi:hypothetical protein